MADFEKELSNLRVEISQSRVKTEGNSMLCHGM